MKTIKILLTIFTTSILVNSTFASVILDTIYATQAGNYVKIEWLTSSEVGNDYFTVERSTDSINYSPLSNILGAGTSSAINNYSYIDSSTAMGQTYFYRVRNTEYSGVVYFSDILQIEVTTSTNLQDISTTSFQLFPNPIVDYTNLTFDNSGDTNYSLKIFDMEGKMVRSIYNISTEKVTIQKGNLKSGLYILKLYSEDRIIISNKLIFE